MSLEQEMKQLIVDALMLDDVSPEEIETEGLLFGEGLGLDSIDALELAIAIDRQFGVKIRAEDESTRKIFRSVATLCAHIESERGTSNNEGP